MQISRCFDTLLRCVYACACARARVYVCACMRLCVACACACACDELEFFFVGATPRKRIKKFIRSSTVCVHLRSTTYIPLSNNLPPPPFSSLCSPCDKYDAFVLGGCPLPAHDFHLRERFTLPPTNPPHSKPLAQGLAFRIDQSLEAPQLQTRCPSNAFLIHQSL